VLTPVGRQASPLLGWPRGQQAMHQIPGPSPGAAGGVERRARAEHLVCATTSRRRFASFPPRSPPCPISSRTCGPSRALHGALKRLPELYLRTDVRRPGPAGPRAWLRRYWTPAVSEQNTVVGRHDAVIEFVAGLEGASSS
jgi:hypothetical protein